MTSHTDWKTYEEAARAVLEHMHQQLGISAVEDKQKLVGATSAEWEIDAIAWTDNGDRFLLVEARRYTAKRLDQEALGAIAFRIHDTGAAGGIVVSPQPLQSGAQKVATAKDIRHVKLMADSTAERYLAEYMGQRFIGETARESAQARDAASAQVGWATSAHEPVQLGDGASIEYIPGGGKHQA